jgi:hypothetical protein
MVAALAAVYGLLLWDACRHRGAAGGRYVVTWFLPLLWLMFAVQRVRHAPLFAIVAAVAIAELLPHTRLAHWLAKWELFSPTRARASEGKSASILTSPSLALRASVWLMLPILTAFALQVCCVPMPVVGFGWAKHDARRWPVELLPELKDLEAQRPGAHVFNTLDFGGFVTFHAPRLKTFIDDRCELFGGEFLAAYAEAERERPERIDDWARPYDFDAALVRRGTPFDRYLRSSPQWRVVKVTRAATLFRRTGFPIRPLKQRIVSF